VKKDSSTCPCCKGPKRSYAVVCQRCRISGSALCRVCHRFDPQLMDRMCFECGRALDGLTNRRATTRPKEGWPTGHFERLAALAAAELPLFPQGPGTLESQDLA
jgi:hypothetical protein